MDTPADRPPWTARSLRHLAAGTVLAALPALAGALAVAGTPTQAYAIGTDPRVQDVGAPPANGTAHHGSADERAARSRDGTPDITALVLPVLGVLCLIARRQLSQRRP